MINSPKMSESKEFFGQSPSIRSSKIAAITGAICISLAGCEKDNQPPEPTITQSEQATEINQSLWDLSSQEIIIIDSPDHDFISDIKPSEVIKIAEAGGQHFSQITDGRISGPKNIKIHQIALAPTGTIKLKDKDKPQSCFSDSDVNKAEAEAYKKFDIQTSRTAIILNGAISCKTNANWAAWAYPSLHQTVYREFNETTYLHEEGHIEGLGHAAIIQCFTEFGMVAKFVAPEINSILQEKRCEVPKLEDGRPNEYSDELSVMGRRSGETATSLEKFTFVELNHLAKELYPIEQVSSQTKSYELSTKKSKLRGIKLNLPKNHPLKQFDKSIKQLAFGIDQELIAGGVEPRLRAIAVGEGKSYSLEFISPLYGFHKERVDIYKDDTLGIKITAENTGDGFIEDRVILHLRNFKPTD